jgi:hypothetical protein
MEQAVQFMENLGSSVMRYLTAEEHLKAISLIVSILSVWIAFQSMKENRVKQKLAAGEKRKAEKELADSKTERGIQKLKLLLAQDVFSIRSTLTRKYLWTFVLFLFLYGLLGLYMKYNVDQLRSANAAASAASVKAQTAIDLATPKQPSPPSSVKPANGNTQRKRSSAKKGTPRSVEEPQ